MVQHHTHHHPESVAAQRARQIGAINRQLATDFHPAVKNVASAGQNLLRAYQNLSRHFYVYTASLYALAYSSTDAPDPAVQQQTKQLHTLTETMKQIQAEQCKWVEYFTAMTLTINRNCKTEKERLKTLLGAFAERERTLAKAVDKGRQMPAVLDHFYEAELEAMRDQQMQRYRFFVDKHRELLRRYRDWMHCSAGLIDRELDDEQRHLDEMVADAERRMGGGGRGGGGRAGVERHNTTSSSAPEEEGEEEEHKAEQKLINGGQEADQFGKKDPTDGPQPIQLSNTIGTANSKQYFLLPDMPKAVDANTQVKRRSTTMTSVNADTRQQASLVVAELAKKFEPEIGSSNISRRRRKYPPHIGQMQQRHSVADAMVFSARAQPTPTRPAASGAAGPMEWTPAALYHSNGPSSATNGVARQPFKMPRAQHATPLVAQQQQQQQHCRQPPTIERPRIINPPQIVVNQNYNNGGNNGSNNLAVPSSALYQQALMFNHTRGASQDSIASSSCQPTMRHSPSTLFAPSDYGRMVECTTAYTAQGDSQMSMAVGERVQLVKNGNRGWVLAKTVDGTSRQAWFPAKYLKLV